jgi:hypothetical protein
MTTAFFPGFVLEPLTKLTLVDLAVWVSLSSFVIPFGLDHGGRRWLGR